MRESVLIFALFLLMFFTLVSFYPITFLHVSTSVFSGVLLFGALRVYNTVLTWEGHDEKMDTGRIDRNAGR